MKFASVGFKLLQKDDLSSDPIVALTLNVGT